MTASRQARIAGVVNGAKLRERSDLRIRLVDEAGGIGGTWYWNRYPGVMCDVESYTYLPLLEETGYMPTEKYASASEIFGPISPIMPFDDFEQAIALANDTRYGLSTYLFTNDLKRMMHAVQAIRSGEVYINKIGPEQFQGFHTGYGLSGQGGDDGTHGFDHYFRKKTVYVNYGEVQTGGLMPYADPVTALPPPSTSCARSPTRTGRSPSG